MSTVVLDEATALTHRRCAPDCRRGSAHDRVGGRRARRSDVAFARSVRCRAGRRVIEVGKQQVGSGVPAFSARARVGGVITRDPLDGQNGTPTESNPYHYTDNDPINRTDPTGKRPGPPHDPDYDSPPPEPPEVSDPDCVTFNDHGISDMTSPSKGQFKHDCRAVKEILERYLPVWKNHKVPIHTAYCGHHQGDNVSGKAGSGYFCASWSAFNRRWLEGGSIYHRMGNNIWDVFKHLVLHEYAHVIVGEPISEGGLASAGKESPIGFFENDNPQGWPALNDLDPWASLLSDGVNEGEVHQALQQPRGVDELLADCVAQGAFPSVFGGYWLRDVAGNSVGCSAFGMRSAARYVNGGSR